MLQFLLPYFSQDQSLDQLIFTCVEQLTLHSTSVPLEELASSGYAPAQNSLGVSAIKEGNFAGAFKYFRLAAEFNLGSCYEEGKRTERLPFPLSVSLPKLPSLPLSTNSDCFPK
jgi:hypothetical protein